MAYMLSRTKNRTRGTNKRK